MYIQVSLFEEVVINTLLRPMEFSLNFDIVISGYAIIYIIYYLCSNFQKQYCVSFSES